MATRESIALQNLEAKLVKVFTDGDVEDAKETLRECLMASRTVRKGRDAGGHIIYEEVPDYPIRLTAGVKIIEWAIGKPVSRSVVANVTPPGAGQSNDTAADLLNLLLAAPDAAADIVAKLQKAARNAAPVEVTVSDGKKPSS
jgi:hypothetical protein